jgi:PLP dependent protein
LQTGCEHISKRLAWLDHRVQAARGRSQDRRPVQIVGVTKYLEAADMLELRAGGLEIFAENRLQIAQAKLDAFDQSDPVCRPKEWHFIGHLQGNKASQVVGHFDLIHSVDSVKLAKRVSRLASDAGITQRVLLQVNISAEEQKQGFTDEELLQHLPELMRLPSLKIEGLMGMAAIGSTDSVRKDFRRLRDIREEAKELAPTLVELSMGMSSDFEIAIEEGATLIRVGGLLYQPLSGGDL